MAQNTKIQWAHHTFNPWMGCTKVSDGCKFCYAENLMDTRYGKTKWGPKGTRVVKKDWSEPRKWNRLAKEAGERHRVFCASLADVFEDWQGLMNMGFCDDEPKTPAVAWHRSDIGICRAGQTTVNQVRGERLATMNDARVKLFETIHATPHLDWLLLTKRPENIDRMIRECCGLLAERHSTADGGTLNMLRNWLTHKPPANVWLGTSIENQPTADERIPHLLEVPAAVRFLSAEPLLGPIDLSRFHIGWRRCVECNDADDPSPEKPLGGLVCGWNEEPVCGNCGGELVIDGHHLHWVIVGGESGAGARPMYVDWARRLVGQCQDAEIPVFVKQLGAAPAAMEALSQTDWPEHVKYRQDIEATNVIHLRDRKGGDMAEWPADLRVRELPQAK